MASRERHVGKTRAQQRAYVENIVGRQELTPTAPSTPSDQGARTDSPMPQDEETPVEKVVRRTSPRQPGVWERHKPEIVKAAIGVVATVLLGGASLMLLGLNREVGQLQQGAQDTTRQLADIRTNAIRAEDRLDAEIRRLRERLDDLRDRLLSPRAPAK